MEVQYIFFTLEMVAFAVMLFFFIRAIITKDWLGNLAAILISCVFVWLFCGLYWIRQ